MDLDLVKLNRLMQINLSTFALHQKTFPQFKNKHLQEDIYILATGKTASKFVNSVKVIGKPGIVIGVNRAFQLDVECDYMFIQDYSGKTKEYIDELDEYRPSKCQKFYGLTNEWIYDTERTIPEYHAIKANALRYRTDWSNISGFEPQFAYDLSSTPLGCFGSITMPALQFALWTHPKRIFLVGCDCTTDGYAYDTNYKNELYPNRLIPAYNKFKLFANKYYPDIEICSLNPVGLKGIFKDFYTE